MLNAFTRKIIGPLFAGLSYLLLEPLIQQASFDCEFNRTPFIDKLCEMMPSEEITNPTDLNQFRHIKERLSNPAYTVWIFTKGDWLKVIDTKSINNISPMGLSFQAATDPLHPSVFELFHICRDVPCKFQGSALNKGVTFYHVESVSIRENDSDAPKGPPNFAPLETQDSNIENDKSKIEPAPTKVVVSSAPKQKSASEVDPSPRSFIFGYKLFYLSALITFFWIVLKSGRNSVRVRCCELFRIEAGSRFR